MSETRWEIIAGRARHPDALVRASCGIHWADYDARGQRVAMGTDVFCRPTDQELAEWDAAAPQIAARAARWAGVDLYVRFGPVPRGERSRNHATGRLERGVSVYAAEYRPDTDRIVYVDGDVAQSSAYVALGHETVLLVTGQRVGRGSDGEPLLRNVKVLATLAADEHGFGIVEPKAR